jgi:hypothetical protein
LFSRVVEHIKAAALREGKSAMEVLPRLEEEVGKSLSKYAEGLDAVQTHKRTRLK